MEDILYVNTGQGATSCFNVRLHDFFNYVKKNKRFPEQIISEGQFNIYKDFESQDIFSRVYSEYKIQDWFDLNKIIEYDHGWQYAFYDEINLPLLSKWFFSVCNISEEIKFKSKEIREKIGDRTCVLYRGNDKVTEIKRTPYSAMQEMAKDSESNGFFIQTDEQDFFEFFSERFENSIANDLTPRIAKNPDSYVMPESGGKVDFLINFLASLHAISSANKLIINTGNTGLCTVLFRQNTKNVWQYNPNYNNWKKLNE